MAGLRVSLHNLGCRVNRVELDSIALELVKAGCELVGEHEAQLIVINTCAVTGEAEAKARKAVRHAATLEQKPKVVATGCVASLFADELKGLGSNVYVEPIKSNIAHRVLELGSQAVLGNGSEFTDSGTALGERVNLFDRGLMPEAKNCAAPSNNVSEPSSYAVTPTGRMRPGIKIQDGCDNRCTYCIVWKARGKAQSVDVASIIDGINSLIENGAQEVVLTGIDLGRYQYEGLGLSDLLRTILSETTIGRVRLSSIEPAGVTPELLQLMASSRGRIAPFLHIPLQSGCDETLGRMNRPYSVEQYRRVIDMARSCVSDIAIACDLIVGFPGETEAEFAQSLATCQEIGFANMHVFRYSKRPGTPAATMPDQVPAALSAERSKLMRDCAQLSRRSYVASLVGKEQLVLVEGNKLGVTGGLVECLVDEGQAGKLLYMTPHNISREGLLDMRTSYIG